MSIEPRQSPPPFRLAVSEKTDPAVVTLEGELDLATAPQLRERLVELTECGVIDIVLDLTMLEFIDSTGLSVLVLVFNRTKAAGGSTVLRNPSHSVMRLLEITGLVTLFAVESGPTLDTARLLPAVEGHLLRQGDGPS
jgi:anti-sigma B factor antagonist